jgi:hypothetical protein
VLDAKGVIRFKGVREKKLDEAGGKINRRSRREA